MRRKQSEVTRPRELDPGPGLTEKVVALPDGRKIRAVLAGDGSGPLVVFEAGLSAAASSWIHTQREISAFGRTLAYDRAGYGGSDVDSQDRTLERIVDDLSDLLDTVGETTPVVLVGHSWGGPILRFFADRHPERVAGLVFVDSTLAQSMSVRNARLVTVSLRITAMLVRLGATKLIERGLLSHGASEEIAESDLAIMMRDYASVRAMQACCQEAAQITAALPKLRRLQAAGAPAVPTVAVQGGRVDRGMTKLRPLLNQTMTALMAAAPNGKLIIVEEAGHLIPQEAPAAVHGAILEVLDAAQQGYFPNT